MTGVDDGTYDVFGNAPLAVDSVGRGYDNRRQIAGFG